MSVKKLGSNPTISGFTMVRNAAKYDYPVVESIKSLLPLVDEMVVNVGDSEDETMDLIQSIGDSKIKIVESKWDPRFTEQSRILAQQTNIAMYQTTGDWAFYIQADEVFHEDGIPIIREAINRYHSDKSVQGLLLDYQHFFGSYDYVGDSYQWYRKEIRVIRNHIGITSWRDAQGFRVDGAKLKVKDSGAQMFHYGWVRPPQKMAAKVAYHESLHHGSDHEATRTAETVYTISTDPYCLERFTGTHPSTMEKRLKTHSWEFDPKKIHYKRKFIDYKRILVNGLGKWTGIYPGEYKNYIKI